MLQPPDLVDLAAVLNLFLSRVSIFITEFSNAMHIFYGDKNVAYTG